MNNVPLLAPENPQQLFIFKEIFTLRGGVTTPIDSQRGRVPTQVRHCGQEDRAVKKAWEGWGPTERR